ncbi:MAG: IS5 family transposase [Actinomycetota bacterium]|nr:IS5 family transposase [Actinomycetota bacterium]
MDLTDEQWEILEPLIPHPPRRADGKGRPWWDPRDVLNGILWVLRTVAPWRDLPERYPPYQTSQRRFQRWNEVGVLDEVLRALTEDLKDRDGLDLSECFVDGTFVGAKKRGGAVGKTKRGKGTKLMALAVGSGLPLAVCAASFLDERPERLIGDRAYDSDPLDEALAEEGIEMIVPHRKNRRKPKTRDGRRLRRHERRWKIERLFAWLGNFRRLVVRYEWCAENYLGFVKLGCIVILLRYL